MQYASKVCFLRTYVLGKIVWQEIHKNCPVEINEFNGAVFVNFWVKLFSQVSTFLKKQTLILSVQNFMNFLIIFQPTVYCS